MTATIACWPIRTTRPGTWVRTCRQRRAVAKSWPTFWAAVYTDSVARSSPSSTTTARRTAAVVRCRRPRQWASSATTTAEDRCRPCRANRRPVWPGRWARRRCTGTITSSTTITTTITRSSGTMGHRNRRHRRRRRASCRRMAPARMSRHRPKPKRSGPSWRSPRWTCATAAAKRSWTGIISTLLTSGGTQLACSVRSARGRWPPRSSASTETETFTARPTTKGKTIHIILMYRENFLRGGSNPSIVLKRYNKISDYLIWTPITT